MKIMYERKREKLPGELIPVIGWDLIRKGRGGVRPSTESPLKQYNKNKHKQTLLLTSSLRNRMTSITLWWWLYLIQLSFQNVSLEQTSHYYLIVFSTKHLYLSVCISCNNLVAISALFSASASYQKKIYYIIYNSTDLSCECWWRWLALFRSCQRRFIIYNSSSGKKQVEYQPNKQCLSLTFPFLWLIFSL